MKLFYVIMAVVAITLAATAQQESEQGTAAAIRALEKEWTIGQGRNDNRTLNLIFDNRLIYIEYGRLVSKGEYLARIKTEPTTANLVTIENIGVRTFGKTAVVLGTYVEQSAKRKSSRMQRWRFVDTWVYKQNGWVLVAAGATPVSR